MLWPPDAKSQLTRKDPDAGEDWGTEEKKVAEDEMDGTTDSMDESLSKLWEIAKDREAWRAIVHGVAKTWTWLGDRTTATKIFLMVHTSLHYMKGMGLMQVLY